MQKRRRWWTLIVAILGVVLIVGSFVWTSVAVPKLVKYPSDVDETPVYTGTVTLYIDPATTAPIDPPKEFPLEVSRNIKTVESSSDLAVVKETASLKATGLFDSVQEQQYVMDRRSMRNVKDDRAWAFDSSNIVDRSPNYRINFPLDNKAVPTPIYSNEQASVYEANPDPAGFVGDDRGPVGAQVRRRLRLQAGQRRLPRVARQVVVVALATRAHAGEADPAAEEGRHRHRRAPTQPAAGALAGGRAR